MNHNETRFEDNFQRIQEILNTLESGKTSLEESLALFEEGMKLIKTSKDQLSDAEDRVKTLVSENGGLTEVPGLE